MEGFVRASGGFMQQQLEKATNLLEQADQKAGDKISVVKERAGLQSTPARTPSLVAVCAVFGGELLTVRAVVPRPGRWNILAF